MAIYKDSTILTHSVDQNFDSVHQPGSATPFSAVYRCVGCGREIVSEEGRPFPPQNHHQHTQAQGAIRWRMVVYADHRPK